MPEFPPCCVENVDNKGGKLCDWNSVCKPIQEALDKYCKDSGQNPCAPMPQMPNGQMCYCCCSCFAYNTPIEASLGEYVMVQDIVANVDEILAGSYAQGDSTPNWQERLVDYSSGISAGPGEAELEFDYMFYITYQAEDGSQAPQSMIVTVDHMFLRPNGKVTPVQYLAPNDKIVASHGGLADVRFVVPARYKGGLHHIMFDGFDNTTLDNHLLSANGVVTADYSVQLAYSTGNLNPDLVDQPSGEASLRASDRAYQARYANTEALAFVADKSRWPKGVTPIASESMINVPVYAKSYLTEAQAADVQANAPVLPPDNTINVTTALWLFDVYGSFFNTPIYLVDWQNETPNAYTWETNRQRFILLTGGLLRVAKFNQEGLAIIIAQLLAVAGGAACVGPADYDGVFSKLRQVWRDSLYFLTYSQGIEQIKALFSYVSEENARANPADICAQPSLDCRVQTMNAASSMMPLPSCANPDAYFGVVSAKAGRRYVAVAFNEPINPETGGSTDNYAIIGPEDGLVTVDSAEVDPLVPSQVRLCVTGLQPSTDYTVTVKDVLSAADIPIDPEHASADFRTSKKLQGEGQR
jgi:hypothetical protein